MKKYRELEKRVTSVLASETGTILYEDENWHIVTVGKPRPSKGECKTDVYALLKNQLDQLKEVKISVKMKDKNEFQENKITKERALMVFGSEYSRIIQECTQLIKDRFENSFWLFYDKYRNTEQGSITMGWRMEITSKERNLSVPLNMGRARIIDCFYRGINLDEDKKNAKVKGNRVHDSGVATHLLECTEEKINCAQDVFDRLISLDEYKPARLYVSFIANNFRTETGKIDGSRALAVCIDWKMGEKGLFGEVCLDAPLEYKGKDRAKQMEYIKNQALEGVPIDGKIRNRIYSKRTSD